MGQSQLQHNQFNNAEVKILSIWSNLKNYNILFDSDVDGNGVSTLYQSVLNKKNLYFFIFDNEHNVYGGYMKEKISKVNEYIHDENSFIFSLIRNNEVKNTAYSIKRSHNDKAFILHNHPKDCLFEFGHDICVGQVSTVSSHCTQYCYDYKREHRALVEKVGFPFIFEVSRIIAIEMY